MVDTLLIGRRPKTSRTTPAGSYTCRSSQYTGKGLRVHGVSRCIFQAAPTVARTMRRMFALWHRQEFHERESAAGDVQAAATRAQARRQGLTAGLLLHK